MIEIPIITLVATRLSKTEIEAKKSMRNAGEKNSGGMSTRSLSYIDFLHKGELQETKKKIQ